MKIGGAETREELQRCLRELAHGHGVWRNDLIEMLGDDLSVLQRVWGINLNFDPDVVRGLVIKVLHGHNAHLIPRSEVEVFTDPASKEKYLNAVAIAFNIAKAPEPSPESKIKPRIAKLREMSLTQRRKWMNDKAPGTYRPSSCHVSLSSSRRYFDDAIEQIVEQLMKSKFNPVAPPKPQPAPQAVVPEPAHAPTAPSPPHLTPTDLEALSRIAALPPRIRIRTQKGFLGSLGIPTMRRHAAVATRVVAEMDQTLRNNPVVTGLAKEDSALAIVALSGGTQYGASIAGREMLDDYDGYDAQLIMAEASALLGGRDGRRNVAAALKLLAQNQSCAIGPGRLDIVARGVMRLAGRNMVLAVALYGMYQEQSRANGRIDLGGKWHDRGIFEVVDWATSEVARAGGDGMAQRFVKMQTYADLTVVDGVSRTQPVDLVSGHPNQVRQLVGDDSTNKDGLRLCQGTLERMLTSATEQHRIDAAVILLEIHGVLARANEPSRELINRFFDRRDLDPTAADFADRLAAHTGLADLSGAQLRERTRVVS